MTIPPGAHTRRRTPTDSSGRSAAVLRTTITPGLGFGRKRPLAAVCGGVMDSVKDMPAGLLRSITWDQGIEMAQHAALTLKADIPVHFAHAHSPWERGTNENTSGLLCEYFPKGTDITVDIRYLNAMADEIKRPAPCYARIQDTSRSVRRASPR